MAAGRKMRFVRVPARIDRLKHDRPFRVAGCRNGDADDDHVRGSAELEIGDREAPQRRVRTKLIVAAEPGGALSRGARDTREQHEQSRNAFHVTRSFTLSGTRWRRYMDGSFKK